MKTVTQPGRGGEVVWRDLVAMTGRERVNEVALSLPWLLGSVYCYHRGWLLAGMGGSFLFFLTGLRQSHGAQHYSMGIPRQAQEWMLFALSLLMMGSMHAVQVSHLNHHRHCLEEEDEEGKVAQLKWWVALLHGPLFVWRLHRAAWCLARSKSRRWIMAEVVGIVVLAGYAASPAVWPAIGCHLAVMMIGECFTGFFAVWTVHHDCPEVAGRTQGGKLLNRISYNMFLHEEHHRYPVVPTAHLHRLAERLSAVRHEAVRPQVLALK